MTRRTIRSTGRSTARSTAVAVAALAGLAALSAPAAAQSSGGTTVSFVVDGGSLSISVPSAASLTSGLGGTSLSGSLGTVSVNDARGRTPATWTSTVSASDATRTGGGGTIPRDRVFYAPGVATPQGSVVLTPGQLTLGALNLGSPGVAFSASGSGSNGATWAPALRVDVPAGTPSGTYEVVITHSVS